MEKTQEKGAMPPAQTATGNGGIQSLRRMLSGREENENSLQDLPDHFERRGEAQLSGETEREVISVLETSEMEFFQDRLTSIQNNLRLHVIGQEDLLRHLLLALVGGGHILIEGVPGLAKTLAVRSLAQSLKLDCKRIQFTPDLLPADLIGTMIFHQGKDEFVPRRGPVFTQVLLADEINRAPAKVQSALLEAMGEQQVTIGDTSYELPQPFFVMATQNPIEEEGTYPLPAAQLDRFDLKYVVRYPNPKDELQLLLQYETVAPSSLSAPRQSPTGAPDTRLSSEDLFRMRKIAAKIRLGEPLVRYIINIVNATR
ncbi:MAG: AAA family ATPase, partial [Spirochaetota bacterium]